LGDEFHLVPLHEAELSAGPGAEGIDGVIEMLAFRRDWLDRLDIAPGNAALARVRGDSMEPLLRHGDVVMIDRGRRDVPARPSPSSSKRSQRPDASLYAVRRGTDCLVKRVERTDWKGVVLLSENWADNPPEFVPESEFETGYTAILGQVRWWAHSVAR
jgi:phage repressor protein C with HTH and peptisase S24 domain